MLFLLRRFIHFFYEFCLLSFEQHPIYLFKILKLEPDWLHTMLGFFVLITLLFNIKYYA